MKWKQTVNIDFYSSNIDKIINCYYFLLQRGKTFPQLNYLIKVNTPRAVMAETKKAFKKLPNLGLAITALSNLKGVGTTMASGIFIYILNYNYLINKMVNLYYLISLYLMLCFSIIGSCSTRQSSVYGR